MKTLLRTSFNHRSTLTCIFCILVCIITVETKDTSSQNLNSFDCYTQDVAENIIPELSKEDTAGLSGRGIFFHETTCFSNSTESFLTPRQACAVESAALTHPNHTVFLLYTAPIPRKDNSTYYRELMKYPNVKVRWVNLNKYMLNTPLENWHKVDDLRKSKYPITDTSNILRYLTLWKYGGTYMDMDIVVLKNMDDLGSNYAGAISNTTIGCGFLKLDPIGLGQEMAQAFLSDLKDNFDGHKWSNNGPGVMTRVLQHLCRTAITQMNRKTCKGFEVYEPHVFYPIHWTKWKLYTQEDELIAAMDMITDAHAIHVWNSVSSSRKIPKDERVAYTVLAEKHCPKVFHNLNGDF